MVSSTFLFGCIVLIGLMGLIYLGMGKLGEGFKDIIIDKAIPPSGPSFHREVLTSYGTPANRIYTNNICANDFPETPEFDRASRPWIMP